MLNNIVVKSNMLNKLRITFYLILLLFLVDVFEIFQTKVGILKALIYCGVLLMPIPLLVMEFKRSLKWTEAFLRKGIPILVMVLLAYLDPLKVILNMGAWKTQTILLVDKNWNNHKVEFQLKDIGAFGYSKRTVEVVYYSKYFYVAKSSNYETKNNLGTEWIKVDETLNEMELK